MSSKDVDQSKRRFLTLGSSAVGAVGGAVVAWPLISSMFPSQRALAAGAPVSVDVSKIEPGALLVAEWRGKPVWIVNRTEEMMAQLEKNKDVLADPESKSSKQPDYAANAARARDDNKNFLVVEGVCTHLGCSPKYRKEIGPADLGADWPGGFFCPCHQSKFDMAGRVFKGVPAPQNLPVPPHKYAGTTLVIGDDSAAA